MALQDDPANYGRETLSRRARKEIDYNDLNSRGFEDAVVEAAPYAKPAGKSKGTKRKQNGGEVEPASKRLKEGGSKATVKERIVSKKKAPTKAAATKVKTRVTAKKGEQRAGRQKAKAAPKKTGATIMKTSKPDVPKQKAKAAPRTSRSKKTATSNSEPVVSDETQPSNDSHPQAHQAEQATTPATPRVNAREYLPAANSASPGSAYATYPSPGRQNTLDFDPSAPSRQFFSATSFATHFVGKMDDPMSDVSSELSDVPDDLDLTMPLPTHDGALPGERSFIAPIQHPTTVSTSAADAASSAAIANMPPPYLPVEAQSRTRRSMKPIPRFGAFVQTATVVDDDDAETSGDIAADENADVNEEASSVEEEVEDDIPVSKPKSKRRSKSPIKSAPPKQPKTPKTTAHKRKQTDDTHDESGRQPKRRRSLIVTLQVSGGHDADTLSSAASSLITPGPSTKLFAGERDGLLTPVSSQDADMDDDYSVFNTQTIKLRDLSRKLTARLPLDSKPLTSGQPAAWADSRQALCETVPYFKMPQSGCHSNDNHVYSFLHDNVSHPRDYMDSDVIISRAGGGMEADAKGEGMVQSMDHRMTQPQVKGVLNDIALQNPLVVIAGNKHQGAVCKFPYRYNVLGWYKPIAVWGEKTPGKGGKKVFTTIKYRFERLGESKPAWHAPAESIVTAEDTEIVGPLLRQECGHCHKNYPQIYLLGWMCLNPDCDRFWQHRGRDAPYGLLDYNPAFLLDRMPWDVEEEPYPVKPPVPNVGNFVGDNLTQINTRGICCPKCGRCNSRRLFKGWKCDNPRCDYQNFPNHIPVKVPMLHTPMDSFGDGPGLARNKHSDAVNVEVSYIHGFKAYRYTVAGVNGSFVHLVSNAKINREPGGADEMFQAIQDQDDPKMDLHLERRRFGVEKMGGNKVELKKVASKGKRKTTAAEDESTILGDESTLADSTLMDATLQEASLLPSPTNESQAPIPPNPYTQPPIAERESPEQTASPLLDGDFMTAFSMNYGMPYKFVASGSSLPFTDAPWPVRAVRADLNWASQTFLDPADHEEFNEELIFAYLEGQKIEYHDDGEEGLGPRIATMSLGGKAKMHLRMKGKHYTGCSKTGLLTPDKPIPGGIKGSEMDVKRLAAWNELQTLKDTDKVAYNERRKALPRELGLYETRSKKPPDLVTVTLNHGDIVLMEGYDVQKYLEHKVVPEGCLRFALTCRVVREEHLGVGERPAYEVEGDEEGMSALRRMAGQQSGD